MTKTTTTKAASTQDFEVPTFKKGDLVQDRFGNRHKVLFHESSCIVHLKGRSNGHIHPSNLTRIG